VGAIMTFVQKPGIDDWNVHQTQFFQNDPTRFNGIPQVKRKAFFLPDFASQYDFFPHALFTHWTIDLTGRLVEIVPSRFSVTDQDQSVFHFHLSRRCLGMARATHYLDNAKHNKRSE
jgi:hypothetical protein